MATPTGGQFVVRRHRAAPPPKTPSTPKLVLAAFQSPATIDFGEQHPDKEAVKTLVLSCPSDAKRSATVEVVRTPTNVAARFEGGAQSITIERGDVAACALTWRPERPGGLRGAVAFRLDGKRRLSATVLGRCVEPPPPPPKKATPRPAGLVRRGVERRLDDRARAVAARRASDAVRETTVPDDASLRAWLDELLVGASSNKTTAPNAEFASAQKSERRRRCAAVWRSESLTEARKNVVEEVAANRLVLRPELDVRCDQVLRAHVLGLFASIEGPWLKAALDAALPLRGDGSLKAQLADHLFGDAETAFARDEDNRGKNGKDGGVYGKQLGEELRKRCVAHVFALLHFLDAARLSDALPQHSRLFSASRKVVIEADQAPSQVTSTQQLARAFGRDCLAGEGDILPHLERLGMDLKFTQTPLHDYDWRVRDFGRDLRDGVRLARAVDVAAHNDKLESDVCAKLRVPAASRLPKLHNVSLVIEALQALGAIPDQSRAALGDWARAVVDGRPLLRTRDLVAALAARFSGAARTVDAGRLRREVGRLGGPQAWDGSTEKASRAQEAADAITIDETSTDESRARTSLAQWAAAVAAGCLCQGLDADGRCAPGFVRAAVQLYHPALSCDTDEAAVSSLGGVSLDVYAACLDPTSSPPERVAWAFAARLAHRLLASRDALQAATKLGAFARATSARKKRPAPPPKRQASPTVLVFANTPPAPRQRKALAPRNDPVPKAAAQKPAVAFDVTPGAIQTKPPATVRFAAATPAPRRSTIVAAPTPAPVRPTPAAFLTPAPRFTERAQLPPATAAAREKGLRRAAAAATCVAAAWRRAATRLTLWRRAAAVHVQCYWRLSKLRRSSARRRSSGDGSVARLLAAKLRATKTTSVLLRSLGTLFLQRCGSGAGRLGRERRAARTVQALGRGGLGRAAARERRGAALALQCLVRRAFAFKVARSPRRDRRARLTFARGAVAVLAHEKAVRDEWQRHTVARVGRLRAYVGARTIQGLARRVAAKSEVARRRVQAWNDLVQAEDDERREAIAAAEARRADAERLAELAETRAAEVSAEAEAQARAAEARAREIEEKCRAEAEAKREAREIEAEAKRKEREARIEAAALAATERLAALRVEEENARERAEAEFEARRAAEEQAAEEAAAQRLQDLKDAEEAAAQRVAEAEEEARERVAAEAERVRLEDERRRAEAAAELRATEAAATARIEELRAAEQSAREAEQRERDAATEKLRRAEAAAAARLEELRQAETAARERAASEKAQRDQEEKDEAQRRAAELQAAEEAAQKRLEAIEKAEADVRLRIEEETAKRLAEAQQATETARSERLRADEAAGRLAELIAAEEGARERIEREAERCLGEEAAARDAAAAEIRAASEDAAARLEELREAEAANRAASDDAAAEKLHQAEAAVRDRLEELRQAEEAARERAAADAAQRAADEEAESQRRTTALRAAEEASQKRLEAIEQAEEEARLRIEKEGAKRAAELEKLREEAAREQAAAAEALAMRQREASREKAASEAQREEVVEVAVSRAAAAPTQPAPKKRADVEARAKATADAVARAQRAAAEATAARERVAAEAAAREQAARVEAQARERRARVDAAKEARRRADAAARAAAEARARAARSAAEAETRRLRSAEQKLAESSQAAEARRAARREEARLTARLQTSRSAIVAEEAMAAARLAARRAADAAQRGAAAMRDAHALESISSAQAEAKRIADAEEARLTEEISRKRAEAEAEAQRMKLEVARKRAEAEAEARRVQQELETAKKAAADEKAQLEAKLAEARRAADDEAARLVDSRRQSVRARAAEARAAADALEATARAKRRAEQAAAAERAASEKRALAERRCAEEHAAAERRMLEARKAAQRRAADAEERRAAEARLLAERRVEEHKAQEAADRKAAFEAAQKLATRRAREAARGAEVVEVAVARRAAVPTQPAPKRRTPVKKSPPKRRQSLGRDRDLPPPSPPPAARKSAKKSPRRRASLGRDLPPPPPPPAARSDRSPLSPSNRRRPKKTPQKVTTATQMTPHPPVAQRSISFESPLPTADAPSVRPTPRAYPPPTPDSRIHKEALRRRRLSAATPPQRTRKVFVDAFDLTEESAARMIQSRWRCHDACWQFFLGLGAAVEIQRRFRGILARSPSRSPVRSPLRIARTVSAPAVVQQSTVVVAVVFPNEGVLITCQALVRGRRVRTASYRRSPPLWSVRKRADAAAKKATPSATLGARCRKALALVESGARLEDVRGACAALESSTRLSPSCCEALAASDGAIAALLKLARACNRSRPHVDLLTLMLRTLANVSERSKSLACRVAETEPCVDVLLDLVQVFRDRPVPFGIATGLLTTLASADVGARNACCSPAATKRLASVAALLKLRDHHAQGAALAAFRQTLATA